jgi:hypothetical protein
MKVTITGIEAVTKRLRHMQTPEFVAETLDARYKHIRCPTHGRSAKHTVNATRTSATFTYCCDELKALRQAKRGGSGSVGADVTEVPGPEIEIQAEALASPAFEEALDSPAAKG